MANDIFIVTTDEIPMPNVIEKFWGMVEYTAPIKISKKKSVLSRTIFDKKEKENDHQTVYEGFLNCIPQEANGIIGIKVSTSIQEFTNGTFLYITYIGTPVKYKLI